MQRVEISPEFAKCKDIDAVIKLINSSVNADILAAQFAFSAYYDICGNNKYQTFNCLSTEQSHNMIFSLLVSQGAKFNREKATELAIIFSNLQKEYLEKSIESEKQTLRKSTLSLIEMAGECGMGKVGFMALRLVKSAEEQYGCKIFTDQEMADMVGKLI